MTRYFNTEGICSPKKHYMVCLNDRLKLIKEKYVDRGKYFVINRGRQYGKTTMLRALAEYLRDDYVVISLDFQMLSTANFADERVFAAKFTGLIQRTLSRDSEWRDVIDRKAFEKLTAMKEEEDLTMDVMFEGCSEMCETSKKPVVLMIDEVDSASNYQVFIDFLAMLRGYYLSREYNPIFHSVILAGVYDIKNLKSKIRPDSEHQYNSPWNIAADFDVVMSFSAGQIRDMLTEYETDRHTGMDTEAVAKTIYQYTSGYPYLVSAVCKIMDEKLTVPDPLSDCKSIWTAQGVEEAVRIILSSRTTLFDSMIKHINEYPELKKLLHLMLFQGEQVAYNADNRIIDLAQMFGYVKRNGTYIHVANRVFETRLYNLFLSEEEFSNAMSTMARQDKNQFVLDGRLHMELVLEKFVKHFTDIYGENDEKFLEDQGRKLFLLYLRSIINGTGNYYIESQTRDAGRTDVIVDYAGEQSVIELKIWRGNEYRERGEEQLVGYLDYFHLEKGYLLSFNFNKKKKPGMRTITVNGKVIVEAVV